MRSFRLLAFIASLVSFVSTSFGQTVTVDMTSGRPVTISELVVGGDTFNVTIEYNNADGSIPEVGAFTGDTSVAAAAMASLFNDMVNGITGVGIDDPLILLNDSMSPNLGSSMASVAFNGFGSWASGVTVTGLGFNPEVARVGFASFSPFTTSTAVPEPTSFSLAAVLAGIGLTVNRRRKPLAVKS